VYRSAASAATIRAGNHRVNEDDPLGAARILKLRPKT
jgi:hypothetical protein